MSRTIVVTGGGTGIGRAVAAAFVATDARVVITGRRPDVLRAAASELGRQVCPIVCDASDPDQIEEMRAALRDPIDVLVNNAGGNREFDNPPAGDLHGVAALWRANLEANLVSAVLTSTALEPQLASGGAVIHIGSFAADRGNGPYGAAKAGLASWNIFLATRLGPRGITSNVVSPGYIGETEFFRDRINQQFHDTRVAETMTGRPGSPGDIADVVHFLASAGARHITGQVIHVNGGALTTR